MKEIDFSLVLALYNESSVLPQSLKRIFESLDKSGLNYEIILIDDKSNDQTPELAKKEILDRSNCHFYQHERNLGRGGTVSEGLKLAKGAVVGFIDVDLEVGPEYMTGFVRKILSGEAEVIAGLRRYEFTLRCFLRYLITGFYHQLVRLFLKLPFRDTETGYKFFNREKILPILEKVQDNGWFWDTEIMAQAYAHYLRVLELPVIFRRRDDKKSTVKIFHDSFDYLIKLIKFRKRFKNKL